MSTTLASRPDRHRRSYIGGSASRVGHLAWFVAGAALAFAVPYLGSSMLELHHDVYLGAYMLFVAMWCWAYARWTGLDVRELVSRHLLAMSLVTIPVLAFIVLNVFAESATDRPGGFYLVFELLWRGVLYGAFDALLLTVFPCCVALAMLGGTLGSRARRGAYVATSLALILVITATYHLGYDQYREDGIAAPELGNVLMSVPMLATTNPVGSVVVHSSMHAAATVHVYETEERLPPATDAD